VTKEKHALTRDEKAREVSKMSMGNKGKHALTRGKKVRKSEQDEHE
jgi:hypothetical protein